MRQILTPLVLVGLLCGCQEPDWQIIHLPPSPGGEFRAEAAVLSEGAKLRIARRGEPWSEYDWLKVGQIGGASFYWSGDSTAVFAYDEAEIVYFADMRANWRGANVRLCNRRATTCPEPITKVVKIPGSGDHT